MENLSRPLRWGILLTVAGVMSLAAAAFALIAIGSGQVLVENWLSNLEKLKDRSLRLFSARLAQLIYLSVAGGRLALGVAAYIVGLIIKKILM